MKTIQKLEEEEILEEIFDTARRIATRILWIATLSFVGFAMLFGCVLLFIGIYDDLSTNMFAGHPIIAGLAVATFIVTIGGWTYYLVYSLIQGRREL